MEGAPRVAKEPMGVGWPSEGRVASWSFECKFETNFIAEYESGEGKRCCLQNKEKKLAVAFCVL